MPPTPPPYPSLPDQSPRERESADLNNRALGNLKRLAGVFYARQQNPANMTVALDPGHVFNGTVKTELGIQSTGTFTAPTSFTRIDRIVIDRFAGTLSTVTGVENSGNPPAIPVGKLPIAQVTLVPSQTQIIQSNIFDERDIGQLGMGTSSTEGLGADIVDDGTGPPGNLTAINAVLAKSSSYGVAVADRNKLLIYTGVAGGTFTLPAPGTLPVNGWAIQILNLSSDSSVLTVNTPTGGFQGSGAVGTSINIFNGSGTAWLISDTVNYYVRYDNAVSVHTVRFPDTGAAPSGQSIHSPASGKVAIATGGVDRVVIDSSGSVTLATGTLTVDGAVHFENSLQVDLGLNAQSVSVNSHSLGDGLVSLGSPGYIDLPGGAFVVFGSVTVPASSSPVSATATFAKGFSSTILGVALGAEAGPSGVPPVGWTPVDLGHIAIWAQAGGGVAVTYIVLGV